MKERLAAYNFSAIWRKGKDHAIPDALSREPVADPTADDLNLDKEIGAHVKVIIKVCAIDVLDTEEQQEAPKHLPDSVLEQLRATADADAGYQELIKLIQNGFPATSDALNATSRQY